jgi:hypothetical protein
MIVASHQPSFLPWVGYYHKMLVTDVFYYLPEVQFSRRDYVSRTLFGGSWMTVRCVKAPFEARISEIVVDKPGVSLFNIVKRIEAYVASRVCKYPERFRTICRLLYDFAKLEEVELVELNAALDLCVLEALHPQVDLSWSWCGGYRFRWDWSKEVDKVERIHRYYTRVGDKPGGRQLGVVGIPVYLAGRGAVGYLSRGTLPSELVVLVQKVGEGVKTGSILEVLGEEESPLDYIVKAFKLVDLREVQST